MKFILSTAIIASLLLTNIVEARWKPSPGMTWNYVLGDDDFNVHSEKAQVIDVDFQKSASTIREYHNAGKKVICYFSGGTIEKHRHDKDKYKSVSGLVRNKYEAWSDENWLDIRKEGLKPLIKNRMKEAVSKNCDALEVDNLDGYQQSEVQSWPDPLTKSDTIKFAKWLGNTAHELGISIGLKNGLFMIDEVGSYFDFAINESCATLRHPECHLYKSFLNEGKAVFGISYESRMSSSSDLCSNLNGLNISMIVKKTQNLEQAGYIFDGKSQCGSGFKSGGSGNQPKHSTPEKTKTTTVKKTTTVNKTTTVKIESKPTYSPVKSNIPTKSITPNSNNVNNNAVNNNVANNSNVTNNKLANNSAANNVANNNVANNNVANNNVANNNVANNNVANNNVANNNAANNNAANNNVINQAVVNGNNTINSIINSSTTNQSVTQPQTNGSVPINTVIDEEKAKAKDDDNDKTIITGVAITGSVVGAAGVFLLLKKNPKQYENLKRNLSRKASSVKRSASRKFSTKKSTTTEPNYYEDTSKYRYEFTQSLNY